MDVTRDPRAVMTMDAGGTTIAFGAMGGGKPLVEPLNLQSRGDDLDACLRTIAGGFAAVQERLGSTPVAISAAFPGPADYAAGIIGDLPNLPAFRGGVPLGPILEDRFGLPVFLNNDGDLFVYGEAIGGLLPAIRRALREHGSTRCFRHLFGVTIGTGIGAGLASDDGPFLGANGAGMEIWSTRSGVYTGYPTEEGVSARALRRSYALGAGIPLDDAPTPRQVAAILEGRIAGDRVAAARAYSELGEALGDCLADAVSLTDSLVVVGGGLAGAHRHFLDAAVARMNSELGSPEGRPVRRVAATVYNLEDADQRTAFLEVKPRPIRVPGSGRSVEYLAEKAVGVGVSVLGTSEASALGAYAFALNALDSLDDEAL
jgi:glucokinase